ncbi:MAG: YbaN family protein [Planctomycetota bacterium]
MIEHLKFTGFCPLHNGKNQACAWGTAVQRFRNLILLSLGLICVACGAVGVLVPGLPTTPFLLLALALFARSSPLLYSWLYRSRMFGPLLQEWQQHKAIRPQVRTTAVLAVILGVGGTCLLTASHPAVKGLACAAGLLGLTVVFWLPVRRGGSSMQSREAENER